VILRRPPIVLPSQPRLGKVSRARMAAGVLALPFILYALYRVQIRDFVPYHIGSGSMEPAFKVGEDWLMEDMKGNYKIGDAVVFANPDQPEIIVVKRIVALESDRVEVRSGLLYVNDKLSPPPQGPEQSSSNPYPDEKWVLKPGEAFVAGDNRPDSTDSRAYGPIMLDSIRGALRIRMRFLGLFSQ
jgi:signal peptidase I